jgi:hypothetical protein
MRLEAWEQKKHHLQLNLGWWRDPASRVPQLKLLETQLTDSHVTSYPPVMKPRHMSTAPLAPDICAPILTSGLPSMKSGPPV